LGPWAASTFFGGKFSLAPYVGEGSWKPHAYLTGVGGIGASFADRIEFAIATSMYLKRINDYTIESQYQTMRTLVMSEFGFGDSRISIKGKILNQKYAKFDLGVIAYMDLPTGAGDITHRNDFIPNDPLMRRSLNNLTDGKKTYNFAIIEALSRTFIPKESGDFKYDMITVTSNAGFIIRTGQKMYSDTQRDYILYRNPSYYGVDMSDDNEVEKLKRHFNETNRTDYFLFGGGVDVRPVKNFSAFAEAQFRIYTGSPSDSVLHPDGNAAREFEILFGARLHHGDYYVTSVGFGKTFGKYSIDYLTGEPVDDNYSVYVTLNSDLPTKALDSDGDGIVDPRDQCPYDPEDIDGFQDTDGCPDLDNDGDGILDADDDCPNEPEDFDGFEDKDGCPDLDNDGDGILDVDDKCPNEPETFNGFEDEDGCPDEVETKEPEVKRMILRDIRFEPNKAIMLPGSYESLDKAGQTMLDFPDITVTIEGHAASTGRPDFEQSLSEERARSVKQYLVREFGIDPDRISTIGFGSTKPISTDKAQNRRIEFVVD
jgi:outer membrane protein OmpA-like peptidoglycan-associated protein